MDTENELDETICRDYLRNVCKRGIKCKYKHPKVEEPENGLIKHSDYIFCHDYQNRECQRENCRFIHCTFEEENHFKATGELPPHVLNMAIRKGIAPDLPIKRGEPPICKDYLKGDCRRGSKCKFRHLSSQEYITELYTNCFKSKDHFVFNNCERNDMYEPETKRICFENVVVTNGTSLTPFSFPTAVPVSFCSQPAPSNAAYPVDLHLQNLEEENTYLKRRVHELKKQVDDLTASNEFLLEQNAQFRLGKQTSTTVTAVNLPTGTNSIAPAVSTIAQISAQLPITNEISVVSTSQPQASLTATQVGTSTVVPVSISQSAAVALAAAPVSVTLTQPVTAVTISQAIPAQNLPTMSLNSAVNTSLVSYPIMTQGMQPIIANTTINP